MGARGPCRLYAVVPKSDFFHIQGKTGRVETKHSELSADFSELIFLLQTAAAQRICFNRATIAAGCPHAERRDHAIQHRATRHLTGSKLPQCVAKRNHVQHRSCLYLIEARHGVSNMAGVFQRLLARRGKG